MLTTRRVTSLRLVSVLCASLISACAQQGPTIEAARCPIPPMGQDEYKIGAGDTLQIVVWRNAELSTTVPVRPDGRISTPLVDDIRAAGMTPSELANNLEKVLGEYLRTPDVSVIVTGQGASNQIQVVGEVKNPQALSYRDGIRILDIIVAAGGLTEFAAGNRTNLVRQVEGRQVECRILVKDLMGGDLSQNINVFPGDVIVVPETRL